MSRHTLLLLHGALALAGSALALGRLTVERPTTNGRTNPLGIGASDVSFGWALEAHANGAVQSAYQLRLGTAAGEGDIWSPERVRSGRQVDVRLPDRIRLAPATRYFWQVKTWDGGGDESAWSEPAWFETGLLNESDWRGAEWIGRSIEEPEPWSDFKTAVEFTLENEALGVFLRASADGREACMWQINVTGKNPVLRTHRKKDGNYQVLADTDLTKHGFTNDSIRNGKHTLVFDVFGSTITTKLDGKEIDRFSGDIPRRGFIGLRTYGNERARIHRIKASNSKGSALLAEDHGDAGLTVSGGSEAILTGNPVSLPLLRGEFHAKKPVTSARVYASARGIYELTCNGGKVGNQRLAPGWTDYHQRIQAQTYDITAMVKPGANVLGAALADGWYRGKVGLGWTKAYGEQTAFVAKIRLTYDDGTTEWFSTNRSWRADGGPFLTGDLQDGETYDARREQAGWDTPEFDASRWKPVTVLANDSAKLVPQPDDPVRETEVLTAKSMTTPAPGTHVYDLGQNMVGVTRIRLTGRKGQTATIRHAEELHRSGERKGQLYTDNFRSAKVTDRYTFAEDGSVVYQPRFTQHGFRYVEVTGLDTAPETADVKGVVLGSDLPATGDLTTSNELINQLVRNIRWGMRGNFLSIPTDTPARDERLGWTGDINVFAPAACRYADTRAFLGKWMDDVRDAQKPDGNLPAVVPQPRDAFDETGVGWSDAAITVPHAVWQATGDERIVRENWDAMKAFYQFVLRSATQDGNLLEEGRSSWFSGDWLSLEENWNRLEEHKVIATACFAENTRMMAEMAAAMGDETRAAEWNALVPRIRKAFTDAYRAADGTIYQNTQTAYALALGMDLIADPAQRAATGARFVEKLAADGNHLRTGFLGTPWLLPALTKIGRDDLAMRILLNEDYPSWGFGIRMGATTVWERWNSIRADGGFGPVDMNSFNHYAYGAVADWMFGRIAGLRIVEPGYRKSRIAPLVGGGGLRFAKGSLRTPSGELSSEWTLDGTNARLKVVIPVNTTAEVVIPAAAPETVLKDGEAVSPKGRQEGCFVFEVGAGTHEFTFPKP